MESAARGAWTKSMLRVCVAALALQAVSLLAADARDPDFGPGLSETVVHAVLWGFALRSDGSSVVAGDYLVPLATGGNASVPLFASFTKDGRRDQNFDARPLSDVLQRLAPGSYIHAAIQHDDKVIVAVTDGFSVLAFRMLRDGRLDPAFGVGGTTRIPVPSGAGGHVRVAIQPDGAIVMGWRWWRQPADLSVFGAARLLPDGAPDLTFGDRGVVEASLPRGGGGFTIGLALQADGKIVLADRVFRSKDPRADNYAEDVVLLRFNADGALDRSFGSDGFATNFLPFPNVAYGVTAEGDGLLVASSLRIGGRSEAAVLRVTTDGRLDTTFGTGGYRAFPSMSTHERFPQVVVDGKGRIWLVGVPSGDNSAASYFALRIARMLNDGSVDASYGDNGVADVPAGISTWGAELAVDGSGNVHVATTGGSWVRNESAIVVARLLESGESRSIAIEYHHAELDHYFLTALPAEIEQLDRNLQGGWRRTGETLAIYPRAMPATSPVCRFYIPPAFGDSHFFSAEPAECADVEVRFPHLVEESPAFFHIALPHKQLGLCDVGLPVYRLWNQRADSNHRYTTGAVLRDQMIARGYVLEGYGTGNRLTVMCAPR